MARGSEAASCERRAMVVQKIANRRPWLTLCGVAGASCLLGLACEPEWDELTNGPPRPSVAGSSGTGGVAGSVSSTGGDPGALSEGGSPSPGGGAAGEATATAGGAPVGGEGGQPPVMDDGAIDLPGTATADSEEVGKGNLAPNAHDGDITTKWAADDGALGHYWTLDLGGSYRLARVKITWEYPFGPQPVSYKYTVLVSDDGMVFKLALDKQNNQETTQEQVAELPAGTTGRYVRITVTGLPPPAAYDYWASFYEARVFGFPIVP